MLFDGKDLAERLSTEFVEGVWGDIDPDWFQLAALDDDELKARELDSETMDNVVLLRQLLDRVASGLSTSPPVQDKTTAPPPDGYVRIQVDRRLITVQRHTTGRAILLAFGVPPDSYILTARSLDGKIQRQIEPTDEVTCDGTFRFATMPRSQTGG